MHLEAAATETAAAAAAEGWMAQLQQVGASAIGVSIALAFRTRNPSKQEQRRVARRGWAGPGGRDSALGGWFVRQGAADGVARLHNARWQSHRRQWRHLADRNDNNVIPTPCSWQRLER